MFPVCCVSTKWPTRPDSELRKATTRRLAERSCTRWGAFPPQATQWNSRRSTRRLPDRQPRWRITVVLMDGRRVDLLDLVRLPDTHSADTATIEAGPDGRPLRNLVHAGAHCRRAFFVAAEFALISARRDRLEALAEHGKRSAVTVIRAGRTCR